jgi:hypothetical protein
VIIIQGHWRWNKTISRRWQHWALLSPPSMWPFSQHVCRSTDYSLKLPYLFVSTSEWYIVIPLTYITTHYQVFVRLDTAAHNLLSLTYIMTHYQVFIRWDIAAHNHLLMMVYGWCGCKAPCTLDVYGCSTSCCVSLYL